MKHGFAKNLDPDAGKEINNPSSKNLEGTSYDERSSCFVNAGVHHGVGKRQPVGSHKETHTADTLPLKSKSIMDYKKGNPKVNIQK